MILKPLNLTKPGKWLASSRAKNVYFFQAIVRLSHLFIKLSNSSSLQEVGKLSCHVLMRLFWLVVFLLMIVCFISQRQEKVWNFRNRDTLIQLRCITQRKLSLSTILCTCRSDSRCPVGYNNKQLLAPHFAHCMTE